MPLTGLRLRYAWILIKAILINVFTLATILLLMAIPIGLLVATVYYGLAAFRELRQNGYGSEGPFVERMHFNLLVRAATGVLALLPMLSLGSLVSGRIIGDRDKKAWDTLLTTPFTGEEILRSKARAGLDGLRQTVLPPGRLVLGIACGVVLPAGVVFAAVDLLLAVWVGLALGFYLSVRPGPTGTASSRIALCSLVLFTIHTPLLWAALASPRELELFASWDARLRWGLVLTCLMIPILTGTLAWLLTRRTLDRFDVGWGVPSRSMEPVRTGPCRGPDPTMAGGSSRGLAAPPGTGWRPPLRERRRAARGPGRSPRWGSDIPTAPGAGDSG
ncbi:MAG: hypothetical protein WKF75_01580 [Singulisphaera sp.]